MLGNTGIVLDIFLVGLIYAVQELTVNPTTLIGIILVTHIERALTHPQATCYIYIMPPLSFTLKSAPYAVGGAAYWWCLQSHCGVDSACNYLKPPTFHSVGKTPTTLRQFFLKHLPA